MPWNPASAGDTASHAVEVRVCYQFTTLFNLHVSLPMNAGLNLGDVWIERTRYFVLDCPPGSVATCSAGGGTRGEGRPSSRRRS